MSEGDLYCHDCWPMKVPVDQSELIWLDGILKEQPDGSHQSQSVHYWLWFTSCSQKAARCYLKNDAGPQSWKTWRWRSNRNQYTWLVSWLLCKVVIIMFFNNREKTLQIKSIIFLSWPVFVQFFIKKTAAKKSTRCWAMGHINKEGQTMSQLSVSKKSEGYKCKKILNSQLWVK